jgi:glycine betaine/choline ABC-type transport system substrate-binding protein
MGGHAEAGGEEGHLICNVADQKVDRHGAQRMAKRGGGKGVIIHRGLFSGQDG